MNELLRSTTRLGLCALLLWCSACDQPRAPVTAELADAPATNDIAEAEQEQTLSEGEPPVPRWAVVAAAGSTSVLTAPAKVSAEAKSKAEVTAVVRGQIADTPVRAGQSVSRGDVVVSLRSPELLLAASQAQRLRSQVAAHQARLSELDELEAEGLARRDAIFEMKSKIASLQAQADAAGSLVKAAGLSNQQAAELSRTGLYELKAPAAGVVSNLNATPGAIYEPYGSPPLLEIIGQGAAWIAVELPRAAPVAVKATFVALSGQQVALAEQPVNQVALPNGTLRAFYRPEQPISLPPDLSGRVLFNATAEQAFQLPSEALIDDDEGTHVLTLDEAGVERAVSVLVHMRNGTSAVVSGDLTVGQRVALQAPSAQLQLKTEAERRPQ